MSSSFSGLNMFLEALKLYIDPIITPFLFVDSALFLFYLTEVALRSPYLTGELTMKEA
jgi:hypothetical protein